MIRYQYSWAAEHIILRYMQGILHPTVRTITLLAFQQIRLKPLPMDRTITGSTATEKYYDFNLSIGKGVSILLSDFGSADLDLFLYRSQAVLIRRLLKQRPILLQRRLGKV